MAFDQSAILDVQCGPRDDDLVVSWVSTDPVGTWFQVYLDRALAWTGQARSCAFPNAGRSVRIDVGAVAASEVHTDLSASLASFPGGGNTIRITWLGGTFLDPDITGFRVYAGTTPGGAVDYSVPVGTVAAYGSGPVTDGFGMGPFSQGGWGHAASSYSWTSGPLAAGAWNVAVVPFDVADNEGTPETASVTITAPPRPPARDAAGRRVTATVGRISGGYGADGYDTGGFGAAGSPFVTLSWLASPGA